MKMMASATKKTWVIVLTTILSLGAIVGITVGTLYATGVLGDKDDYTTREFVEDLNITTIGSNDQYTTRIYTDEGRDDDDAYYTYGTVKFDLNDAYVITLEGNEDVETIVGDDDLVSNEISMQEMMTTGITYKTNIPNMIPLPADETIPLLTNFTMTFTDITYNGKVIDESATVYTYAVPTDHLEWDYRFEIS